MSKLGPKCQYFVWPPLFPSTALTLLGMEFTRASQVTTGVLFHSSMMTSQSWWMLETLRFSTFRLKMPHRCSIGFRSGDMLDQSITFTLSFFINAVVFLEVCLGSLSCWYNTAAQSAAHSASACHSTCWHSWIPQWTVSPQCQQPSCSPDHDTPTTMLDCRQDTLVFVLLTWLPPHTLDTIWIKYVYIGLIRPQDMVPVIMSLVCLSSENCLQAFLCIIFRRGFLLGRQPSRPIWCSVRRMVWALTGWPPHPFNLCSNAGSTHTSRSQTQPLDMTLSTCFQLLWSIMARPVLNLSC